MSGFIEGENRQQSPSRLHGRIAAQQLGVPSLNAIRGFPYALIQLSPQIGSYPNTLSRTARSESAERYQRSLANG